MTGRTITYAEVRDRTASLANRVAGKVVASELVRVLHFHSAALRRIWNAAAWPELNTLEEFTLTTGATSRRIGDADEVGYVKGCYDADPRALAAWHYVDFEETGDSIIVLPQDAPLTTIWLDYLPPCLNLLDYSEAALPAVELPERFGTFLTATGAGHLLRPVTTALGDETLALAETEFNAALASFRRPRRFTGIRVNT